MYPQGRHPTPLQSGQPFKFSILEICDRIKEEFQFLQAQYHSLKLECEKLASEKTEMQRHYVMYYEMSYGLNIEMHKQAEIVKRLSGICAQIIPFLTQEHQQQVLQAMERAKQVTVGELNSLIGQQQLQPLSHHAPPVPLTPRPAGLVGSGATGLLALSGALAAQAQLAAAAKEDRAGGEAEGPRVERAPSRSASPSPPESVVEEERPGGLGSSGKQRAEDKDLSGPYESDEDKSDYNLVVDEDQPSEPPSPATTPCGKAPICVPARRDLVDSPASLASSLGSPLPRAKELVLNELPASTPAPKSCDSSPPQDASTPGPSSAGHLRQLAAKPAPCTDSVDGIRVSSSSPRVIHLLLPAHYPWRKAGLLLPRVCRRADAAGALPLGRARGRRHPAARAAAAHAGARRGGLRRHHQRLHAARVHGRQGLRESVGRGAAGRQDAGGAARLPEPGQLHSFLQAAARRPESNRGRRGQHLVHLGPGGAHPAHQGGAHLLGPRLLRSGRQPRRQGLLFLLQRRQHRGLGPAEPDHGQAVPGPHGRCQLHRHFRLRHSALDRGPGQHGALLGPAGGPPAAAARLQLPDLLPGPLPQPGLAGGRHGEQQRGGATCPQAREVPAAPSRELCARPQIRLLRALVCEHWERQPAQRLEDTVWSQHFPVQGIILRAEL
nr:transducin-like enhancer protein 2 isoform X3 [Mirounga angustirostris]